MTDPSKFTAPTPAPVTEPSPVQPVSAPTPAPSTHYYQPSSGPLEDLANLVFGEKSVKDMKGPGKEFGLNQFAGASMNAQVAPVNILTGIAQRLPIGWLPGGTDEQFRQHGKELLDQYGPTSEQYMNWLMVKETSDKDILGGANYKADWVNQYREQTDRESFQGRGGPEAITAGMGFGAQGSVGAAFAHAVMGYLGVQSAPVQRAIAGSALGGSAENAAQIALDVIKGEPASLARRLMPHAIAITQSWGENRIQDLQERLRTDPESLSPEEKDVAERTAAGKMSPDHAIDILTRENQAFSNELHIQLALQMATDPLTFETLGAGALSSAGLKTGARLAASGAEAEGAIQKIALLAHGVQSDPLLGPIARLTRASFDPLGAKFGTKGEGGDALQTLSDHTAVGSYARAMGRGNIESLMNIAKEAGVENEMQVAIRNAAVYDQELLLLKEARRAQLAEQMGPELLGGSPEDLVDLTRGAVSKDFFERNVDHMVENSKQVFTQAELDDLAGRATRMLGQDKATWAQRIANMNPMERAALHNVTYQHQLPQFIEAVQQAARTYAGDVPLERAVLSSGTSLDREMVTELVADMRAEKDLGAKIELWNIAARRHPEVAAIGMPNRSQAEVNALIDKLEKAADDGKIMRVMTPEELNNPAMAPVKNFLDQNTIEGKPLWKVGFKPEDDVAMGIGFDPLTGTPIAERDPTLSHSLVDALPNDEVPTKNIMGQFIGKTKSSQPISAFDRLIRSSHDQISVARRALEVRNNFSRAMVEEVGVPKAVADDIYKVVAKHARWGEVRLSGVRIKEGTNLWTDVQNAIPDGTIMKNGNPLTVRDALKEIVYAADGDARIIGLGTKIASKSRSALVRSGIDSGNVVGEVTSDVYNKLRYVFNPSFVVQKVTDLPWFRALRGALPVGSGQLSETLQTTRRIEDAVFAATGTWRDTAMDMAEFVPRNTLVDMTRTQMIDAMGGQAKWAAKLEAIRNAPNRAIANNMTLELHERMGDIVKKILDTDLEKAIKAIPDEAMRAEVEAELPAVKESFRKMQQIYTNTHGREISNAELGQMWVEDQIRSNLRVRTRPGTNGLPDLRSLIHESSWSAPNSFGELQTFYPDELAKELGYADAKDMRGAMMPTVNEHGIPQPARLDIPGLKNELEKLNVHPDVQARVVDYFSGNWRDFWKTLELPLGEGGLDISSHYAKEAQGVIARLARDAGMDPWEYLTGVMKVNLGPGNSAERHIGDLISFLKAADTGDAAAANLQKLFESQIQASGRESMFDEFLTKRAADQARQARAMGSPEAAAARPTISVAKDAKADPAFVGRAQDEADRLSSMFPDVRFQMEVKPGTIRNNKNVLAGARHGTEDVVEFSDRAFQPDGFANVKEGFHARPDIEGLVQHEFAHKLSAAIKRSAHFEDFKQWWAPVRDANRANPVSGYAGQAHHEGFAEIVVKALNGEDPNGLLPKLREWGMLKEPGAAAGGVGAPENLGYHAGDLRRAGDTVRERMTPGRGTGHFGTGVYFVSDPSNIGVARGARPVQQVNLDNLNLYKPASEAQGRQLHDALKLVNDGKVEEAQQALKQIFPEISPNAVEQAISRGGTDSASTEVMKGLGYEGVDVRHIPALDNTDYGTVVYRESMAPGGAAPSSGNAQLDLLQEQYPLDKPLKFDQLPDAEGQAGEYVPSEGTIRVRTARMQKWLTEDHSPAAQAKYREQNAHMMGGAADRSHVATTHGEDAIITHEYGHALADHLHAKDPSGLRALTQTIRNNPPSGRSLDRGFRDMEHGGEAFPEAFASIVHGEKDKWGLLDFLRKHGVEPKPAAPAPEAAVAEAAPVNLTDEFDKWMEDLPQRLAERVDSGKPHPNADVEAVYRQYAKYVRNLAKGRMKAGTRTMLRNLVNGIPEAAATGGSHSQALVQQAIYQSIKESMDDIYMLAEMGTSRSAFMQSLNHPLFGMYPASYMWGKVIPQTARVLSKNPFGITYGILDTQRAIALQRQYDSEFDKKMKDVDRSELAFVTGYVTPSMPWEPMEARTSPLVRELGRLVGKGQFDLVDMMKKELYTMSPERWAQLLAPLGEAGKLAQTAGLVPPEQPAIAPQTEQQVENLSSESPAAEPTETPAPSFQGPVTANNLRPVLDQSMTELQRTLAGIR